jgi:hypothetical protein
VLVETTDRCKELAEHTWGPVAGAWLEAGDRYTRAQLETIREFLRFGTELSYRRAEEVAAETQVARRGARPTG